jgi:hypothetical protein
MENTQISLVMNYKRAQMLMTALDIISRIGTGRFVEMIKMLDPKINYADALILETELKDRLHLRLPGDMYRGSHEEQVPDESKIAFEACEHLRRELAWVFLGKDWRKDERDFATMSSKEFDDPCTISDLPGEFKTEIKRVEPITTQNV